MKINLRNTIIAIMLLSFSCSRDHDVNFFSVKQDIEFGQQLDNEILSNPKEYPILDEVKYADVYEMINGMKDEILQSDDILYPNEFVWKIRIINSSVLNAFAAPGGYIYFYTGLMKFLDNSAQLAGVLAHEMAHVDRRHSTEALTKRYGFSILANIIIGKDSSMLAEIIANLAIGAAELKFSRTNEYEADKYSVLYLDDTKKYNPKGIRGFFDKLETEGYTKDGESTSKVFEFLSTHPSDANRIENIETVWSENGSHMPEGGGEFQTEYQSMLTKLP